MISGVVILSVYLLRSRSGKRERIGKQQWKDVLILSAYIIVGGQGLLVWGAQYLSSGMTALLNSTIPLWVALIAALILREHMTKRMVFGLVAGFVGLVILINPFIGNDRKVNFVGLISLTLSSIFWAVGSLYSTRSHNPVSILASAGMLMLLGGIMLTFISFIIGEFGNIQLSKILSSFPAYVYLIFLCTSLGYAEFFWLLRAESASIANSFAYIVPVVALFLGWLILKEPIYPQTILATCVIVIGVVLMVMKSSNKVKPNLMPK